MVHVLKQVQVLPIDLKTAWSFFSNPENLNDITPPDLSFRIVSTLPQQIYAGLMIAYRIKIFGVLPFEWVTEITHVDSTCYFVDEQRAGPYSLWHHEHHFKEVVAGVEMTDVVHYKLPLGRLGNLFHNMLIKPKLKMIFEYRKTALTQRFTAVCQ